VAGGLNYDGKKRLLSSPKIHTGCGTHTAYFSIGSGVFNGVQLSGREDTNWCGSYE
jgi:hypothetical protein